MKRGMSDRYSDNDDVEWPEEEEDKESSYQTYLDREASYEYANKKVCLLTQFLLSIANFD